MIHHVMYKEIVYAFPLILIGCATYRGLVGFEATDLSDFKLGMSQEEVEQNLGKPVNKSTNGDFIEAHYEVDRGYIPPAEKDDSLKWGTPVILFVDLATLGLWGKIIEDQQHECQLGEVVVIYDSHGKVFGAKVFSIAGNSRFYMSHKTRRACVHVIRCTPSLRR